MCGVVAFSGNGSQGHRATFVLLCIEATIRGQHAFGIAYHDGQRVQVFKSTSFGEVLKAIPNPLPQRIVFHNRYCTSGDYRVMANNQPLFVGGDALAFNGTVDMGTKQEMEQRHNTTLTTDNDGELVLQDIKNGKPFRTISDNLATFAGVFLGGNGRMFAFRNEMRPLWCVPVSDGKFIVSTRDIARRAILDVSKAYPIKANEIMDL